MEVFRDILLALVILVGIYLAVILSYLLIPATIFLLIFFVVREMNTKPP